MQDLSVVIPVYNEEGNLRQLYTRLINVIKGISSNYEIIFVDDGSTDNTSKTLKELHEKDNHVKVIKFTRNFGQHIAITAGLDYCKGDVVVLMDGDLQDPPEEIPKLYEKFKEGYDIAYAVRKTRTDPVLKKAASKFFYSFLKILAKVEIPLDVGILRIMSRQAADGLRSCKEKSRFITALMSWTGFSHVGVETRRNTRYAGKTKYSLFKSIQLAVDGITSFSYVPLRIATYIGLFVALISFVTGIYMLIKKIFFGIPIAGYASVVVSILFIGGVQLLIIGIMGEYIGRIYTEVQNRPMYIVQDTTGFGDKKPVNYE